MEEVVEFGLARSRLTAIPRFVFSDFIASTKALQPQLARATHGKMYSNPHTRKIKTSKTLVYSFL